MKELEFSKETIISLENQMKNSLESKLLADKLTKENVYLKEELDKSKLTCSTAQHVAQKLNKEMNDIRQKNKEENSLNKREYRREIKSWKKDLGQATSENIKLKKRLDDYVAKFGDFKAEHLPKRKKKKQFHRLCSKGSMNSDEVTCSICAAVIDDYVPRYFLGNKFNPACDNCHGKDIDDPFSSFSEIGMPSSMVSYWNPVPSFNGNLQKKSIGSILSLRSHYVKIPRPGDRFISMEECLEIMKKVFEITD